MPLWVRFESRLQGPRGRTGPEALRLLRQTVDIDLLFTDVVMPEGIDGVGRVEEARHLRPGIKVPLLTSGYVAKAQLESLPLLVKPRCRRELAQKIE